MDDFAWPASVSFAKQHEIVLEAASTHHLPLDPLGGTDGRRALLLAAQAVVAETVAATPALLADLTPPLEDLLP